MSKGSGWLSRYSDSLRAGRSGDRIPVGARFSYPCRPPLGPTQPPVLYNGYRVFTGGKAAGAWRWPPTRILRRGWRKSRAIHLLPFWAFVACCRGELYLYLYHGWAKARICFCCRITDLGQYPSTAQPLDSIRLDSTMARTIIYYSQLYIKRIKLVKIHEDTKSLSTHTHTASCCVPGCGDLCQQVVQTTPGEADQCQ